MDIQNKQTFIIDLRRGNTVAYPHFTQYDTNTLEFVIKDKGADADLTAVTDIVVNYKRKDGVVITRSLEKAGNVVTYTLGAEEMKTVGVADISLSFFEGANRLSTAKFKLYINDSLGPNFEGGEGMPLLQELFVEVAAAVQNVNDTNSDFNTQEETRQTQEATRQQETAAAIERVDAAAESAKANQLAPVANFAAIATTYPAPANGDEVQTLDDGKIYRRQAGNWKYVKELTPGPVSLLSQQLADIAINADSFAILSGESDDTLRLKRAIAYAKANNKNLYFPPKTGGYIISGTLLIDFPCKLMFSGVRSHIYQNTWGIPAFDIRTQDVSIEGECYISCLQPRTKITTTPVPEVSADPKAYCSGIFLYGDCSRFKADFIHIYGFVAGITHVGNEMDGLYIDIISVDTVDFGIFGNGVNNANYSNVIGKNIVQSQGEPEHVIYLTKLATDSKNLYLGTVKANGVAGGNSALSIRGTDNFKIDTIQCSNVGGVLDVDRAKGVVSSIIADCTQLILNNRGNITAENSADVVIDSVVITSNAVYVDASNKTYAVACSTSSKIAINKARITMINATPNTAVYSSGNLIRMNKPEFIYNNPLPATIYAIMAVSSTKCEIVNPYMDGASRLLFYASTATCNLFYNHDRMKTPLDRDGISCNILGVFPVTFIGNQNKPSTLQANYAIPFITTANSFVTANTAATTISNFRYGSNYQEFTVYAGDTNTAIQNNSTIVTKTGANIAAGSWKILRFMFIDGVSYQL